MADNAGFAEPSRRMMAIFDCVQAVLVLRGNGAAGGGELVEKADDHFNEQQTGKGCI